MGTIVDVSGLPTVITDGMAGHDANHETIHKALQSYATVATTGLYSDLAGVPAFELRGTGSPYSVITPASAGIYYTDIAATNGAIRWVSTGTTNTSWIVEFGDTGWRDVTALLSTGFLTAGSVLVARYPKTSALAIVSATFVDGSTHGMFGGNISGFTPDRRGGYTIASEISSKYPALSVYQPASGILYGWSGTNTVVTSGAASAPCTSAWPTTLPGTPA